MLAQRLFRSFAKNKPLKISAITSENGVKFTSQTGGHSYEIRDALENLMGSLAICEVSAIKALSSKESFKVNSINFTRLESSYNLENFKKGGKGNQMEDIILEADFDTNGTQEQLDALQAKVHHHCPMYCTLTAAGIKIHSTWRNNPKK